MKKKYILISLFCCLFFVLTAQAQKTIYVNVAATGTNNGSSWANAFTNFQSGVNAASAGDNVFVAAGTYQPASGQSFFMKEGVKIYGGFAGIESSLSQRNLAAGHSSILKGNGNSVISNTGGITTAAVLDGFTITDGISTGGGMHNISSSPTITNCIFSGNPASVGGGMANDNSSPTVTNCIFSGNSAVGGGGGMSNYNSSAPNITNCTFSQNSISAVGGGGMYNVSALPTITNCVFWGNTDISGYHDIQGTQTITYSYTQQGFSGTGNITGSSDPFVNSSNPAGADGIFGTEDDGLKLVAGSAAINAGDPQTNSTSYAVQAGNTDITGFARIQNSIVDIGAYEYKPPVKWYVRPGSSGAGKSWSDAGDFQTIISNASNGDSVFVAKGTYQPASGQSFSMEEGVKIYGGFAGTENNLGQRNLIAGNSSILKGNGYRVILSSDLTSASILDGFTITGGNAPGDAGGGMYNHNTSPTIINCYFSGNSAQNGGGMFNDNSSPTLTNCVFSGNTATSGGGGMSNNFQSSPTLTNCTFSGNTANTSGGGISNSNSSPTIINSIFWGNTASIREDISGVSGLIINYSFMQTAQTGTGNITGSSNPFVNSSNPAGADGIFGTADDGLKLVAGSAAINAGDPQTNSTSYAVQAGNTDITGSVRILYNRIDMGAYEKQTTIYVNSANASSTQNGLSWATAYNDFQVAVNNASAGDSVFVAKGTYQPASGESFSMKEGVKIYGGFAGTENILSQRNLAAGNSSVLKGNSNSVIRNSGGITVAAVLDGFTITDGNANNGGGMSNFQSSPTIANCTFSGNTASNYGGGIGNNQSTPTLTNCIFSGNTSGQYGGGMFNTSASSPSIVNCTFSGNTSSSYGGGIFSSSSSLPTIANSIFWGNTAPVGTGIYQNDGTLTINYSYTQTAQAGTDNITGSSSPFVNSGNPAGEDGIWGTADDGLKLAASSAAINAGDPQTNNTNYAVQAGNTDITGSVRILYDGIDMGAYEFNSAVLPVTLVNFTGSLQDGIAQLQWYTGVETNFNHFVVQKATVISSEGWQSQPQGEISAKGNNSSYAYITTQIEPTAYYRLKMVDKDGNSKYSNIVALSQSGSGSVLVYPNPAKDHVNINMNKAGNIRIYDASGRLIKAQALQVGVNRIDVSELTGGVYYGVVGGTKVSFVKE